MPQITLRLHKMHTVYKNPVQYSLKLKSHLLFLNDYLGSLLHIQATGRIYCIQCGRATRKSFQRGYCFPCYKRLLACNLCIIHPERCQYYAGTCSGDDWAHAHCVAPHVVYLANSSGLKVGITRKSRFITRWIEQGASAGLCILETQNRHLAGLVELVFKQFVADKTNWRALLKGPPQALDLQKISNQLQDQTQEKIKCLQARFDEAILYKQAQAPVLIRYPVLAYPTQIHALNLDKTPMISGTLQGIKGQYWILDTGVFPVHKFSGYEVQLTY